MTENTENQNTDVDATAMPKKMTRQDYRKMAAKEGKREFTLKKMQEYNFWPKDEPTPGEKQKNESEQVFQERKELEEQIKDVDQNLTKINKDISSLYGKKAYQSKIVNAANMSDRQLRSMVAKALKQELTEKRALRKQQRLEAKKARYDAWLKKKAAEIVHVGKRYSSTLYKYETDEGKLRELGLPLIKTDQDLATMLGIPMKQLRFIAYHRAVVTVDHYIRYTVPKKKGGVRQIHAPMPILKAAQTAILNNILEKLTPSPHAHGFIAGKSIITNAEAHHRAPGLLIKLDIKDFFPSITYNRVYGLFKAFGYSGHISTILAIICTYCKRVPIKVKGKIMHVSVSDRILPQGSPASPMITNHICYKLDKRLAKHASVYNFKFTRYADDLTFSHEERDVENLGRFMHFAYKTITEEGFQINSKKTRFYRDHCLQAITGITVNNQELGLTRKWILNLRAALHNAEIEKQKSGSLEQSKIEELKGMVNWAKSINPTRYAKYIEQAQTLFS